MLQQCSVCVARKRACLVSGAEDGAAPTPRFATRLVRTAKGRSCCKQGASSTAEYGFTTKWLVHTALCQMGTWSQLMAQCSTDSGATDTSAHQCCSLLLRGPSWWFQVTHSWQRKACLPAATSQLPCALLPGTSLDCLSASAGNEGMRDGIIKGCCTGTEHVKYPR